MTFFFFSENTTVSLSKGLIGKQQVSSDHVFPLKW